MWFKPPAAGWQRKKHGLKGGRLLNPIVALALVIFALCICNLLMYFVPAWSLQLLTVSGLLLVGGGFVLFELVERIRANLLDPLAHLRNWAHRMQKGNLSAKIPVPKHGEFAILAADINALGESLRALSREMDEQVKQQTLRLEQKTRALEILYEVASQSNTTSDIEQLLQNYLQTLVSIVEAKAGTVRLLTQENQLRLVASIGAEHIVEQELMVPIERCLCAQDFRHHIIRCDVDKPLCGNLLNQTLTHDSELHALALPLQYQNTTLGIYHLFHDKPELEQDRELADLLTNIVQHLSLAIEKFRMDNDSKRLTIMQERTMLAHELHDSLAQTLASLRFQVNMLQKSLDKGNYDLARDESVQLKSGLDEANSELRELLAHFRVHMDERGLIPATEALIKRFENESGISVYFQNQCKNLNLPPIQEVQVLHIIQESLANARKHSQAEHVRVLIRETGNQQYHVLIEDDGVGIREQTMQGKPGEHVGLSIMQERARRINGTLGIDSEEGEGTRIELDFSVQDNNETEAAKIIAFGRGPS